MAVSDILAYIGMTALLVALWYITARLDRRAKAKSRAKAYRLLDMDDPPVKDMKKTMRELQLYGGRLKRDPEFIQLRQRLSKKLDAAEYRPS